MDLTFHDRRRNGLMLAVGTAAALAVAVPGHAELIEYTDRDAWLDAAGEVAEITFTEFPHGTPLNDQYEDLGILFTDGDDFIFYSGIFSDGAGALGGVHDELRVSFAEPIQWLGTDFLGSIQYSLYSGGDLVAVSDEFIGHRAGFGGIFSDVPFDAAILRDPAGGTTVDNLYFQSVVPAPGALAIWSFGFVAILRRRGRRTGACGVSRRRDAGEPPVRHRRRGSRVAGRLG